MSNDDDISGFAEALITSIERGVPSLLTALAATIIVLLAQSDGTVGRQGGDFAISVLLPLVVFLLAAGNQVGVDKLRQPETDRSLIALIVGLVVVWAIFTGIMYSIL